MGKIQKRLEAIYKDMNEIGKITYTEIAKKINMTNGHVGSLIDGRRRLNEDNLLAIMDAMGITLADLDTTKSNAGQDKLHRMLSELISAGKPWSTAARANIEELYRSMIAGRRQSGEKEAVA